MQVVNNPEKSRYELHVEGEVVGVADYSVVGDQVILPHTEIDRRRRGHGLGAVLVRGALEDVRATGRTVVPSCWYVAQYIDQHPEFGDLVAS